MSAEGRDGAAQLDGAQRPPATDSERHDRFRDAQMAESGRMRRGEAQTRHCQP